MGFYNDLDWDSFVETAPPLLCEIFEKEEDFLKTLSGNVLEIGCGTGRGLIVLAEKCNRVVGIDKEQVMVDASKKKNKKFKNVEIYKREASNLLFPDNTFDSIVCIGNTFGNFEDNKVSILLEMKRVCKKNGLIMICVYNEKALDLRVNYYTLNNDKLCISKVNEEGTVFFKEGVVSEQFSKDKLKKIFSEANLNCEIIELNSISYMCICKIEK